LLGELAKVSGAWGRGGELEKARESIGGKVVADREKEEGAKSFRRFCLGAHLPFQGVRLRELGI
jgi:hypothetical protein